jgi:siderophore synthetase component
LHPAPTPDSRPDSVAARSLAQASASARPQQGNVDAGPVPDAPEGRVPEQARRRAGSAPGARERAVRGREGEKAPRQGTPGREPEAPTPGSAAPHGPSTRPAPDPLDHPDAHTAAQHAAVENLLRCWVRETGLPVPACGVLRVPLPASGTALLTSVLHRSPTGWHRFGPAHLASGPGRRPQTPLSPPLDAVAVAALLAREAAVSSASPPAPSAQAPGGGRPEDAAVASAPSQPQRAPHRAAPHLPHGTDLVARVADSVRRTADFISRRRAEPADVPDRFLAAEQALVLGHPLHPAPKSREGLTEAEGPLYSPESRGSFRLHWLAVAPSVLAADSAWTERGRPVPAPRLTARLADARVPVPDGYAALPAHPWQWREVRHRPEVTALLESGLLQDLGEGSAAWSPTSSVRTVHRSGAPAMLKLSLGLRITNSRRENLRKELRRGVEVHRLLRSGLVREWQAAHPGFDIVRDPAWLGVDSPAGAPVPGLDVVIRHNPFRPTDDVVCVAGLVAPRPCVTGTEPDGAGAGADATGGERDGAGARSRGGAPVPHGTRAQPHGTGPGPLPVSGPVRMRSRLAEIVTGLAARTGRPVGIVAAEWFLRYLEHVVRPVLWLDAEAGIALEAHQQNTLVHLDADGWPLGGRYRDNQGYYFRESRRDELEARLPGIGALSDTFVSDEVTDERFAYYLGVNNVLGLIGAFGSQRLADEETLLAAFRDFLRGPAAGPSRLRTPLPARLLDSPVLRCKANLLTRLHGLDELVGPVDTQSVYVTIANPLHR